MNDTPANQPSPPVEEVAAHLRGAVSALVRSTRAVDRLPPIPAAVLDLLAARGPMTTAELAASRGVRHQTMAATVKELTDAGHLAAGPDPADARKKILSLTEAGRDALDADRRQRTGLLAAALEQALDDEELRMMARALELVDRVSAAVNRMTAPR
ncbi:DNA-binding MarR family transcriptional regulator [Catenulispora sp. GP43]|uniref:MarR family winged helix-turn-helix transcriptional regulator n=1 Tax=Catenulispora sp. GP43 TaxID=3156263 RepID=UPI003515128B